MSHPSDLFMKLNSPASVKQEPLRPSPSPTRSDAILQPLAVVKTEPEPQQPPLPQPQQHQEEVEQQQQQQGKPQFLKSINDLADLSSAIHAFKCRFDDLTKHIDFLNQAIDSRFNERKQQKRPQIGTLSAPGTTDIDGETEKKRPDKGSQPKSSRYEIERLCETMCGIGLRKYIVTHLSNVPKLREEVPEALKLAPEPPKLILDCIGRFFLQGIKAYTKDSPMIPARNASVLALEFFLLMMGGLHGEDRVKIPANLKEEAEKAAVAWRKRLISEGGLDKASEVDARGLLLFVACFGVPKRFRVEDLGHLLRLCNLRSISDALKGSPVLPHKMQDIVEAMAKNGMHVEAVNVASIFGLEEECSLKKILTLFLQESARAFRRAKEHARNSPVALRMANEKQLKALKSVVPYLEDCSSDVTKFLDSWNIKEEIIKLGEENLVLRIEEKRMTPKRKSDEMGSSSRVMSQEIKRSRFGTIGSPLLNSSHVNGLHEQRTTTLADGMRPYDGLMPSSYDSTISGHITSYPAASAVPHGPTVGSSGMMVEQTISTALPYGGWGQHSVGQSASMTFANLHGPSSTIEGFAGLPHPATSRTSADLYSFADSIGENVSYTSSSHRTGAFPNVEPGRQSTYMYQ